MGGKKTIRIIKRNDVLGPHHLRLGAHVRKGGFFYLFFCLIAVAVAGKLMSQMDFWCDPGSLS